MDQELASRKVSILQNINSPSLPMIKHFKRLSHEPPPVIAQLGWKFHHIGIPTTTPQPNETHLEQFGLHVSGYDSSPFGIEWMRFDSNSCLPEIIRTIPHIAFEVPDLESSLIGQQIIFPPTSPSGGVRSAMILHNGAPIELISFSQSQLPM